MLKLLRGPAWTLSIKDRLARDICLLCCLHYGPNSARNVVNMVHISDLCNHALDPSPPLVSGLGVAALLTLPLLLLVVEPSSALRSKNPVQRSANDSLVVEESVKNSADNEGVLGVRWNGDIGKRKLLVKPPGLANPACSFCSSVQLRRDAINCSI
jgi:hypothetical protein